MAETGRVRNNHFGTAELRWHGRLGQPALSGYLVHLVGLVQPNKPDRPNRPNEQDRPAEFFNILLRGPRPSVEEAHSKISSCHARRKYHTDYPTRREARSPRFTTSKFPTQIRHMGFRPEPFII